MVFKNSNRSSPQPRTSEASTKKKASASAVDHKTAQVEKQVEEVIDIMEDNVVKMRQRGDNLDTLQSKSEALEQDALVFKKQAKEVQRKMWWKSHKMTCILIVVILIVLIAIAGKHNHQVC